MPLYEYECLECGERFEIIQKFSDNPLRVHAEYADSSCKGELRKLLSAPAIQFKGSGWYVTDYGKAGEKPRKEAGEAAENKGSKSSDAKDSSSKVSKPPTKNGASASAAAPS